jgi:hypothetical protein
MIELPASVYQWLLQVLGFAEMFDWLLLRISELSESKHRGLKQGLEWPLLMMKELLGSTY